jgi:hypothetical protein
MKTPIKGLFENSLDQRSYEKGFEDAQMHRIYNPPHPAKDPKARAAYRQGYQEARGEYIP